MPKEIEIENAARSMIKRHGANAAQVASLRVATYEREGQIGAAVIWKRIIVLIYKIIN